MSKNKNRGKSNYQPNRNIGVGLTKGVRSLMSTASSIDEAVDNFKRLNNIQGAAPDSQVSPMGSNAMIRKNEVRESDLEKKILIPTPRPESPSLYKEVTLPKLNKNIQVSLADKVQVIGFPGDFSGCGHFRMLFPFAIANAKFARTGKILFNTTGHHLTQEDALLNVRTLWFQRPQSRQTLSIVDSYKKYQASYKYKVIAEVDDYIWEVPSYNTSRIYSKIESSSNAKTCFNMADEIVTTTSVLAREISEICCVPLEKIRIIPNYLPRSLYTTDVDRMATGDIKKPKILYNGSGTHYDNVNKLYGDLDGNIKEFIEEYYEKYDFVFMGGHPWFVDNLVKSGKIASVPWLDSYEYPTALRRVMSDFTIMPLKNNIFNRCKSDIKYLEACATGSVAIGSKFKDSPYENINLTFDENTSPKELSEMIDKHCSMKERNDILMKQYTFMSTRWMDTVENIMEYIYASTQGCDGWAIDRDHPQWNDFKHMFRA